MARSPHTDPGRRPTHRRTRLAAVPAALVVLFLAVAAAPALGADRADGPDDPTTAAVAFLRDQQQPDGGFGPGVLTPEAVAAVAQQAQRGDEWSAKEAVDAVSAVETSDGATPLDALDDLAADATPELAAQLITRAVVPMGLDPENFDAGGDGDPVDLVHVVAAGRRGDGSYGSLSATAEAVLALVLVGRPVNAATLAHLEAAQQANGGWNADGDPDGEFIDPATTGLVLEALVAAGVPAAGDTSVVRGLTLLATTQRTDGGWPVAADGDADAIATAWSMGGIRAAGYDPTEGCWRDATSAVDAAATPYVSPAGAIEAAQGDDGAIEGGLDPVASTALGVQGLLGNWLPTTRAEAVDCVDEGSAFSVRPSLVVLVVLGVVVLVGAVVIMRRGNG